MISIQMTLKKNKIKDKKLNQKKQYKKRMKKIVKKIKMKIKQKKLVKINYTKLDIQQDLKYLSLSNFV